MLFNFMKTFILFLIIQWISGNGLTFNVFLYSFGGALVYLLLLVLMNYFSKRNTQ